MEIGCTHCGARYAFDADLIPVAGYDAQCTHCQAVFFVHRDHDQAAPVAKFAKKSNHEAPKLDAQKTEQAAVSHNRDLISMTHAQAAMLFGAEAQDASALAPSSAPSKPNETPTPKATLPPPKDAQKSASVSEEEVLVQRAPSAVVAEPEESHPPLQQQPAAPVVASTAHLKPPEKDSVFEHGDDLNEIAPLAYAAEHIPIRGDMQTRARHRASFARQAEAKVPATRHRRRGLVLGLALVVVIGISVAIGVMRSKQLHIVPQVQDAIHVVSPPKPAAVLGVERGLKALLEDSLPGFMTARQAFEAARAIDPQYTDAFAGEAIVALLQSQDLHEAQVAQHKSQTHPDGSAQAVEALHRAGTAVLVGSFLPRQTPLMATAQALFVLGDAHEDVAKGFLNTARQLEHDQEAQPPGEHTRARLMMAWRLLAEAQYQAQANAPATDVVAAFQKAITLAPELRRARWLLARWDAEHGRLSEAKTLLVGLSEADPPHVRARQDLSLLPSGP